MYSSSSCHNGVCRYLGGHIALPRNATLEKFKLRNKAFRQVSAATNRAAVDLPELGFFFTAIAYVLSSSGAKAILSILKNNRYFVRVGRHVISLAQSLMLLLLFTAL